MTFEGKISGNRYRTVLTEDSYSFEFLNGLHEGTKTAGDLKNIDVSPDSLEETSDLRFLGWLFLVIFSAASFFVIFKHGRWDVVGLIFIPMLFLPSLLILRYFRWTYSNRIFNTTSGTLAFGIPEKSWLSDDIRARVVGIIQEQQRMCKLDKQSESSRASSAS